MAAYLTHLFAAKEVYERLGEEEKKFIRSPSAYYAGALGGDPFFVYRPLRKKGYNLGRLMHRKNVYGFFCAARGFARATGDYSYIFGYITHYAADTAFHPGVYAAEYALLDELPKNRQKDKVHFLIERDIDKLLAEKLNGGSVDFRPAPPPSDEELDKACALIEYAANKAFSIKTSRSSLKNALRRFPKQQDYFFDPKGKRRKRFLAFENAFGLPHVLSYLFVRNPPDERFSSLPAEDGERSIAALFDQAVQKAAELISAFSAEGELDKTLFSSDFNAGKRERKK